MQITSTITAILSVAVVLVAAIASGAMPSDLSAAMAIMAIVAMAVLGVVLARKLLQPLGKLKKAGRRMARGDLASEVYRGRIDEEGIRNSDEVSQLVMTFESMRRRLLYLEKNNSKSLKEKSLDLARIRQELAAKETELQRTIAMLAGQSEELKRTNEGLSARNRELSDANDRLQKLDKTKTDFILVAAHELRTPMQTILGFVELAQKGSITNDQAWQMISAEGRRLASLSTDLLDAGHIESGTLSYNMKAVDLKELLNGLSASSSKFATQYGIVSIKTDFDGDVKILGDKIRLAQALENIVNNSTKFAGNGTIAIQTRNHSDKGLVEIKISDDGPGIPPEILPVLFNKFVTKTDASQRGTGLGLFITRSIVEAHNGKITAENNAAHGGKGATFTISLPIYDPKDAPQQNSTRNSYLLSDVLSE